MEKQNNTTRQLTLPTKELGGANFSLFNSENQVFSILHIDDDETTLQLTKIYLEEICTQAKVKVESESDLTTLSSWIQQDFDCYIVDYNMPQKDGLKICKKIRELKNSPIVLYTNREQKEMPTIELEQLNIRYHQKGSDPENYYNLTETIMELIQNDLESRKNLELFIEG